MKKIILALVVLMLASPAWANVVITCAQVGDTNEVVISFDASGEGNLVRAFSLNIQLDNDATILDVGNVNADYYISPGTIQIDTSTVPPTIDYATPVAEYDDLQSDTLLGLDSNGITIEMGSLYAATDPCHPTAPLKSGDLLSIYLSESACITITGNVARAGSSGVVMEDPDELVTVDSAGCCAVIMIDCYQGMADYAQFELVGSPPCWCYPRQCLGDADGKPYGKQNNWVSIPDLTIMKAAWAKPITDPAWTSAMACADFDHLPYGKQNNRVAIPDLTILKTNWAIPSGPAGTCLPGNETPP